MSHVKFALELTCWTALTITIISGLIIILMR